MTEVIRWPGWRYGPDGKAEIFERAEDVPEGWEDHPAKLTGGDSATDMAALRAEYQDRFGKRPFMGWDETTLREKLA